MKTLAKQKTLKWILPNVHPQKGHKITDSDPLFYKSKQISRSWNFCQNFTYDAAMCGKEGKIARVRKIRSHSTHARVGRLAGLGRGLDLQK